MITMVTTAAIEKILQYSNQYLPCVYGTDKPFSLTGDLKNAPLVSTEALFVL